MAPTRPIVIYLEDAPRRTGSGAHLRFFSNVRAWCDAGAAVHLVRLVRATDGEWSGDPDLPLASVHRFPIEETTGAQASILARIAYRLGIPSAAAVRMYFPPSRSIADALAEMGTRIPGALHVMEGELLAAVAMHQHEQWVWSEHEALDDSIAALQAALTDDQRRVRRAALKREARFAAAVQRRILRRASGIIYISQRSARRGSALPERFRVFLPLSIADENESWARPAAAAAAPLRLLHLGSVSHLPTYSSLRYLLGAVFPLVSPRAMARIRLTVVGRFDPRHPRCVEIQQLARSFPNVELSGFATSLRDVYAAHDAQIVASVEGAGIRTRIVESLARGLPVLATPQAVDGMPGFEEGRHYVPLRDPAGAAQTLERLVDDRGAVAAAAVAGTELYRSQYSRAAVRDLVIRTFAPLLEQAPSGS